MRQYLLALALAAASLCVSVAGPAGTPYAEASTGAGMQTCTVERIAASTGDGRAVVRRVRICR